MPLASQEVLTFAIPENKTFAANFTGSYGYCDVNPTGSPVYAVNYDGGSIGTITVAAGTGVFTFATVGGVTKAIVAGHVLQVIAPSTQDATLSSVAITLVAT